MHALRFLAPRAMRTMPQRSLRMMSTTTTPATPASASIITSSPVLQPDTASPTSPSSSSALAEVLSNPVLTDPPLSSLTWYYPSEAVIGVIQSIHEYTGAPWWAAIMLNTFIIRGALLPLIRKQQWAAYRMVQAQPDMTAVGELIKSDPRMTPDEKAARMRAVFQKHQVTPASMFTVAVVQFPLFISCFLGLQHMAETHPTLASGGLLWFTDLTAPDTTYALPAAMTLVNIAILRLGDGQPQHAQMKIVKNVFSVAMLAIFPFVMSFPTVLFMHWGTMSTLSLTQSIVLRSSSARVALGLPPKMTHTPKPLWGGEDSPIKFPMPPAANTTTSSAAAPAPTAASRARTRRTRK